MATSTSSPGATRTWTSTVGGGASSDAGGHGSGCGPNVSRVVVLSQGSRPRAPRPCSLSSNGSCGGSYGPAGRAARALIHWLPLTAFPVLVWLRVPRPRPQPPPAARRAGWLVWLDPPPTSRAPTQAGLVRAAWGWLRVQGVARLAEAHGSVPPFCASGFAGRVLGDSATLLKWGKACSGCSDCSLRESRGP